ncbi:MAG: hypothetical protein Q8N18_25490 [Opitutaceae bacterium]|nr:hypothetical protein [Opitutaceae bacterium]
MRPAITTSTTAMSAWGRTSDPQPRSSIPAVTRRALGICVCALLPLVAADFAFCAAAHLAKPAFQYQTEGIAVPAATADEPKVGTFDAATIQSALKYLDDGARAWSREKRCVACHTTGSYLMERPALTKLVGRPSEEILALFVRTIPEELPEPKVNAGVTYYPQAENSVWRAAGLAEWDRHVTGKLSAPTERALRDMLLRQSGHGGYLVLGEVEIPHFTTDYELTLQAARAIATAPGWLASLKDADLLRRVDRMKFFLRGSQARNDYERALRLQLATVMPDLVTKAERESAVALLWEKQLPDGGWSTRRMSDPRNWGVEVSDPTLQFIASQSDAADPGSDSYMTAFAIVLLRESGVPAGDARIQRGIAWLKREQRVSGRWWMQSLYRGKYHFTTFIATCQALKALALCGELPIGDAKGNP